MNTAVKSEKMVSFSYSVCGLVAFAAAVNVDFCALFGSVLYFKIPQIYTLHRLYLQFDAKFKKVDNTRAAYCV